MWLFEEAVVRCVTEWVCSHMFGCLVLPSFPCGSAGWRTHMLAEPLLKTSRRRPQRSLSTSLLSSLPGAVWRITKSHKWAWKRGRRWRVGAFSSAEKQLVSNQRAERDGSSRTATDRQTLRRGACRNPRNCTFPQPSLFQDGENSVSIFSSTSTHPQASICFPPPSILESFPLIQRLFSTALFPHSGSCTRLLQIPLGYFHFWWFPPPPLYPCLFMTVVLRGR